VSGHSTATSASQRTFIPGMGLDWLLPFYDPLTTLLGLGQARRQLLGEADLRPGHRVLDIGCGTGSLAVVTKTSYPGVDVVGVDPDDKALARAARKARRAGVRVQLDRGFSDALPYPDASFDRVLSSFMFHHLQRAEKEHTLDEVQRVMKPGGSLHLLDFGGPASARHHRSLHSHHRLADNDEHTILALLRDHGFIGATRTTERAVLKLIRVVYYRAGSSRPSHPQARRSDAAGALERSAACR
jgi:ubiquinone/menaquinone biosynthesis C-methylase UbiE